MRMMARGSVVMDQDRPADPALATGGATR